MLENIYELVFITSESCNLQCSYCDLAKRATQQHLKETNNIIQSLESGAYLQLYKYFVNQYNINKNHIHSISLWGQEPTLTLHAFNTQINDILNWLPNLQNIFFSTNGVAYTERIIDYINTFNEYFKIHARKKIFTIHIQFSFDGIKQNIIQRGVDSQIVINNIKKIITFLNSIKLNNNLKISFGLHGVLTIENIKQQLNDKNNLYWQDMTQLMIELNQLIIHNQNIYFKPYTAFFNYPYNATSEDGKLMLNYAKYCYQSITKYYPYLIDYMSPFWFMKNIIKFIKDTNTSNNQKIINNFNYIPDIETIHFQSCNPCEKRINLRYDGTLLYCQNTVFDLLPEDLANRNDFDFDLSYYQLKNPNFQPNILTSSENNIFNFINSFQNENPYNYSFYNANIINLMNILLLNKQIDKSYNDYKKILNHALYLSKFGQCYYARKNMTGSIYCNSIGHIRLYCNGLLDYLEDLINKELIEK